MAARRDEWLSRAEAKRPDDVAELLETLRDTSAPKLEARLLALTQFPVTSEIAGAAVDLLNEFPFKFVEHLSAATIAVGVALVHRAKPSTLKKNVIVHERLVGWRNTVVDALVKTLEGQPHTLTDLDARLAVLADGPGTQVTAKAAALLDVTRDGRIGDAAAQLLVRPPVKYDAGNAYFTVAALLLAVHGGPAHRKAAEHAASKLVQLSWLERVLPNDAPTSSTKKSAPNDEEAFLKLIAEDPSDASRVDVFTDWLLERGDPRGEFNALQRAGMSAATLQKKHEKQWLRSLARGARRGSTVFRGGLLREVFLYLQRPADVPLLDEPLLATIESLELVAYLPVEALLSSPMWKSLTSLTAATTALAVAPTSLLARLTTVGVRGEDPRAIELAPNATKLRLVENWREPLRELPQRITALEVETSNPAQWFSTSVNTLDVKPAYWRETEDGKRRVQFHFENGRLTRVDCDSTPDQLALEPFCFEPLQTLKPAQRRGATANVKFTAAQRARFDSLCG